VSIAARNLMLHVSTVSLRCGYKPLSLMLAPTVIREVGVLWSLESVQMPVNA
jgi:hypothetical protein